MTEGEKRAGIKNGLQFMKKIIIKTTFYVDKILHMI